MSSLPDEPDTAREFQARRLQFVRIARFWTGVLAATLVLGAIFNYSAGTLRQSYPTSYWVILMVLIAVFGAATLRIRHAYERLFSCPRCSHEPQAHEIGIVLFLGWRASRMDPESCAVCGARLK